MRNREKCTAFTVKPISRGKLGHNLRKDKTDNVGIT
jgi:hypothetical protein